MDVWWRNMVFLPLDPFFLQFQLGAARELDRKDREEKEMKMNLHDASNESPVVMEDRELIAQLASETDRMLFTVDLMKAKPFEGLSSAKRSLLKAKLKEQARRDADDEQSSYFKWKVKKLAAEKEAKRIAARTEMERKVGDNDERAKLGLPPLTEKQLRLRAKWEAEDTEKLFEAQARTEWAAVKSRIRWRRFKKVSAATLVALAASFITLAAIHPQTIKDAIHAVFYRYGEQIVNSTPHIEK
jgi:hypothetical protein